MGSISLNLIGGYNEVRTEQDNDFFILNNENVRCMNGHLHESSYIYSKPFVYLILSHAMLQLLIPIKDTTYWCSVFALPDEVKKQEKYIYKVCIDA